MDRPDFNKISDYEWEIPASFKNGMRVPSRVIASKALLDDMENQVFEQVTNMAFLPGAVKATYAMADAHSGYGAPIGGLVATDPEDGGVISPGLVGYDINCGMRLIRTGLTYDEVEPHIETVVNKLFDYVPAGVGREGSITLKNGEFRDVLEQGAQWCVEKGYGWDDDLDVTEENGCMTGADADKVSDRAMERGRGQLGTLGSGNHYLEIQRVHEKFIADNDLAEQFGLFPDQVVIMLHCGSRGFGHQIATDYVNTFQQVMGPEYGISIPDKELMCAPFQSEEGQNYYKAMQAAVNYAFASRQVITHRIRQVFEDVFQQPADAMNMEQIYDVSHNTAKLEEHTVNGTTKDLVVHRKGATRAFGPGHKNLPDRYKNLGQPVIIGGSMETGSWLLTGTKTAEEKTFGTTAHGAGRKMSRTQAKNEFWGEDVKDDLRQRGIYVKSASDPTLAEEAGGAYKSVDEVIEATANAGISRKVSRFVPIGNIKG